MTENEKQKVFFPNLDGLRFLCFLSVFFFHSFATNYDNIKNDNIYKFVKHSLFSNGNLGVNFFFVLSGFLITYLLLTEKSSYKKINIGSFYMRRILRIWPLFYACVLFGFFLFPLLKSLNGEIPNETASMPYYLVFLNNFDFINKGLPDSSVLGVLWSVAIEEQFYVIWPLLLAFINSKYYKYLFIFIISISFIFRYINANSYLILEHHTLSCISDMTVGGFFALHSFNNKIFLNYLKSFPKFIWFLIYSLIFIIFFWRNDIFSHNSFLLSFDRFFISILFALVIVGQCFSDNTIFKMGDFKIISTLGKYTYGLYCLHFIGILIVAKTLSKLGWNKTVFQVLIIEGVLSLLITILIAYLSYNIFEKRFLVIKDKFARITKF